MRIMSIMVELFGIVEGSLLQENLIACTKYGSGTHIHANMYIYMLVMFAFIQ